jgi:hypothetical protein
VSREVAAAGPRSELVEATLEAIGYEGWPYETNTTFRERHQLDTLYDILSESQPEGQWDASDQGNRLTLTFRSGKDVSLQFGAEESVRALYGTPLMEFFRKVAPPTDSWRPHVDIHVQVKDLFPAKVREITLSSPMVDAPPSYGGPKKVFSSESDITTILSILRDAKIRKGFTATDGELDSGELVVRTTAGAEIKIKFHYGSMRREFGIRFQRLIFDHSRYYSLDRLKLNPPEAMGERVAHSTFQLDLDQYDSDGIRKIRFLVNGKETRTVIASAEIDFVDKLAYALSIGGRLKAWQRPANYTADWRMEIYGFGKDDPLVVEYDPRYAFEEWGPEFRKVAGLSAPKGLNQKVSASNELRP